MKEMSDRLFLWGELLNRHNFVVLIWNMKGEEGYPGLEYVSENIRNYGYEADEFLEKNYGWIW